MSMRTYAGSGYIVKASELINLLPVEIRPKYIKSIEDVSVDDVQDILDNHFPSQYPRSCSSFSLDEEDGNTELETDTVYVEFPEDELFEKIPTRQLDALRAMEVFPELSNWTSFS